MKRQIIYIVVILFCFSNKVFSQATTVNVAGDSSTLPISNNVQTIVDPSLTITADGNLTGFIVTITGSYTSGDVLSYTGALPSGITVAAFDATTRSLVFSGATTAANWQTLLRTVTITTVSATCFQEQRQVSFVAGNKYYNNLNGHFYEKINFGPVNFGNAVYDSATRSYFGRAGYLATMTSLAEVNFIWKIVPADGWIGASDDYNYINTALGTTAYANQGASEGNWYWVTGPEKGTLISVGNVPSTTTQSGQFSYWASNEPNNYNNGEHYGQFYTGSNGRWNDLPNWTLDSYITEYGGMSTDNVGAAVVFTRNLALSGASSGTITGGNTTVCTASNYTTLTLTGLVGGGSVSKWQYSYDDFLTAGTDITNTSTTLAVSSITQNTYYRAIVNTPSCTNLTTSSTRIYVSAAVAGNIVPDNNTICVNANVNFTLNGYSGTITKWQVSTSSTFASGITDIVNTTAALSYQLTSVGTYYFRAVIASCSSTVYTAGYSVSCIAGTAPIGGTISNASFCNGTNSGTLTLSVYTGTISKWQYSTDGGVIWTDLSNTTATYNYSGITVTRKFRALLTNGSCGTAWSAVGVVSVSSRAPSINYAVSEKYYLLNAPTYLVLTNSAGAAGSYSVSPALPTGLILGTDGSISGTPTVASTSRSYTITATNPCGNHTAVVKLETGYLVNKQGKLVTVPTQAINKYGAVGTGNGQNIFGRTIDFPDGQTSTKAALSAYQIKTNYPLSPDGIYWITIPGLGPKQTYCLMDSRYDGGGWMLALKATTGTTFNYDAPYWTTANTMNPTDLTRSNADAKYDVMNGFLAKDMLAIWPDISKNFGESGSIDGLDNWNWLQNSFHSGATITLINKFAAAQTTFYTSTDGSMTFNGYGTAFTKQEGFTFYGINYTGSAAAKIRWGFAWNNETDQNTNDVSGGIGMAFGSYSAGDYVKYGPVTGVNRSARVEIYIR